MVVDFLVHYLRHDDIVHKVDSVGYRVFLTTIFFVSYFDTLVFVHPYNIFIFFSSKTMPSDHLNYFFILFFQFDVSECPRILNDDSSETAEFIKVWRTLESQLQHYDLSKAKLVSSLLHTLLFFVQYTSNPASLSVAIIVCQDMQLAFFKLFVCCCVRVSLDNYSGYFFVDICSNQGWNSLFCLLLQHVAPAHRCA